MLESFAASNGDVKKVLRIEISPKERIDWEDMFNTDKAEIEKLSAEIKRNEGQINAIVYKLSGLTQDEIGLLETAIS